MRKRGNNYNVIIEYRDENEKIKQKSVAKYTNKKDAEKHLIDLKSSINNNSYIISKDITFVDRYKKYIEDENKHLSPGTLKVRTSFIKVISSHFLEILNFAMCHLIHCKNSLIMYT